MNEHIHPTSAAEEVHRVAELVRQALPPGTARESVDWLVSQARLNQPGRCAQCEHCREVIRTGNVERLQDEVFRLQAKIEGVKGALDSIPQGGTVVAFMRSFLEKP